jgi:hypothetical protein
MHSATAKCALLPVQSAGLCVAAVQDHPPWHPGCKALCCPLCSLLVEAVWIVVGTCAAWLPLRLHPDLDINHLTVLTLHQSCYVRLAQLWASLEWTLCQT